MVAEDRKQKILELLKKDGVVRVAKLSQLFDVSEVTVRNYLADMENKGLLTRTHGGAISSYKPYCSMNFNQRLETNQREKDLIAEKIAELIEPGDTVMLNAGTTTLLAYRHLPADYHLNIVTNSVSIALEAAANPNHTLLLAGGCVHAKYQFTFGESAAAQIRNYHADRLILSVDGIDLQSGFSTYYSEEVGVVRAMIEQSRVCLVAADQSKFRRNAFAKIGDVDLADCIVTTATPEEDEKRRFDERGVRILTVK